MNENQILAYRLGVALCFLILVAFTAGCKSCPPCVPTHEIVEVKTAVYSCPTAPELPPLVLPPWPSRPENWDELGAAAKKAWYVEMLVTYRARKKLIDERIDDLEELLGAYRETE